MNDNKKFPRYVGLHSGKPFHDGPIYVEFLSETHARGVLPDMTHSFDRKNYYPCEHFINGLRVEITQFEAIQRIAAANGVV